MALLKFYSHPVSVGSGRPVMTIFQKKTHCHPLTYHSFRVGVFQQKLPVIQKTGNPRNLPVAGFGCRVNSPFGLH